MRRGAVDQDWSEQGVSALYEDSLYLEILRGRRVANRCTFLKLIYHIETDSLYLRAFELKGESD